MHDIDECLCFDSFNLTAFSKFGYILLSTSLFQYMYNWYVYVYIFSYLFCIM